MLSPLPLFVSLIDEVFLYGLLVESKDPSTSFHRTLVEGPKDCGWFREESSYKGLFRKKAPGMKKEVGYIILCQCYSFVWEIAFEAYTDKKRRMIEGSGASH
ncbi:Fructose-1,6-bisphosphatase class 3 [Striga asiatica]|uniref:Fructose-1,6-bisphosphatase class 3 n=1 Tax=Striga asiatica TaxID=4170 RepID=A0A5A7QZJ1_STRAF|nr:Fructose-1,6-bisphosphatase class 3 [Striga asiatica]